jgi:hypothetical protein
MEGLTPGRMVHYVLDNGEHRAAVITKVLRSDIGLVNIQVFTDVSDIPSKLATTYNPSVALVEYSEVPKRDTWHWIEPA